MLLKLRYNFDEHETELGSTCLLASLVSCDLRVKLGRGEHRQTTLDTSVSCGGGKRSPRVHTRMVETRPRHVPMSDVIPVIGTKL